MAGSKSRIGITEIGSRSVRFFVADFDAYAEFTTVDIDTFRHRIDPGNIGRDDIIALNRIIDRCNERLKSYSCDRIRVYGTEICRRIQRDHPDQLSIVVDVLSPREEAIGGWATAIMCERNKKKPFSSIVIDEGSGSTEVSYASWDGSAVLNFKHAELSLGSSDLVTHFANAPKGYLKKLPEIISDYAEVLEGGFQEIDEEQNVYLAGGVATKLAWLKVRNRADEPYQPYRVNGVELSTEHLIRIYGELSRLYDQSPKKVSMVVDPRPGSTDEGVRVLSSAPFLALLVSRISSRSDLLVTGYGLRHGMSFLLLNDVNIQSIVSKP